MVVFSYQVGVMRSLYTSTHMSRSGPKRYDYVPEEDEWIYSRDQQSIGDLMNTELSTIFGRDIDLGVHKVSVALS